MYRVGHQIKHHYWPYLVAVGLLIPLIIISTVIAASRLLQPHPTLRQSSPIINYVAPDATALQHITKAAFRVDLPAGWQAVTPPNTPYTVYSWQGTTTLDTARHLDIYLDTLPRDLAVNHLLPVQSRGDRLDISGPISGNCADFAQKTDQTITTGAASAQWQGVNFICDVANYERDVVATGSVAGVNTVTATGPTTGPHHLLLVYTDNSPDPDYSRFISIVKSFRVL